MTELLVLSLGDSSPAALTAWRWGTPRSTAAVETEIVPAHQERTTFARRPRRVLREAVC
jgi:hypothetical protein